MALPCPALPGANVIVVDCDLRQSAINGFLIHIPEVGLLEVLNGTASLEQALYSVESGAKVLPLAQSPYTPKDVLRSPPCSACWANCIAATRSS